MEVEIPCHFFTRKVMRHGALLTLVLHAKGSAGQ